MAGAARTVVRDGVNGLVADPTDATAFAAALHRAADPAIARQLRAGARRTGAAYTPAACAERLLGAFELARALRGDPRAPPATDR